MPIPTEYSSDLDQKMLDSLLTPIQRAGQEQVGQAISGANARGLEGSAEEGSIIGSAQASENEQLNQAISGFQYNLAGQSRQDRLLGNQETYKLEEQGFQSSQAEQEAKFQEQMAQMGYAQQDKMATQQLWQDAVSGFSSGIGKGIGSKL